MTSERLEQVRRLHLEYMNAGAADAAEVWLITWSDQFIQTYEGEPMPRTRWQKITQRPRKWWYRCADRIANAWWEARYRIKGAWGVLIGRERIL